MEEFKYVIFGIGEQKYAMNLACVNGIEQDYMLIPVPNAPEGIQGIINLRGTVVPVYSLRQRFGLEPRSQSTEKSLLLTISSGTVLGYEVDRVYDIEAVEKTQINPMPAVASNEENEYMESVLRVGSQIVISININKVLDEETVQRLNKMVEENH